MISVDEILGHLDGSGFTYYDVAEIAIKLTEFSVIKRDLENKLQDFFNEEEKKQLFGLISTATTDRKALSDSLNMFTMQQREIYLRSVIDGKSVRVIAEELGLSTSATRRQLITAMEKIKDQEIKSLVDPTPEVWEMLIVSTDTLTQREKKYCLLHLVEEIPVFRIAKELGLHKSSVRTAIQNAKGKFNTDILKLAN